MPIYYITKIHNMKTTELHHHVAQTFIPNNNEAIVNTLTPFHTHAEIANETNPEQIVYYEKDVIALLNAVYRLAQMNTTNEIITLINNNITI